MFGKKKCTCQKKSWKQLLTEEEISRAETARLVEEAREMCFREWSLDTVNINVQTGRDQYRSAWSKPENLRIVATKNGDALNVAVRCEIAQECGEIRSVTVPHGQIPLCSSWPDSFV